MKEFRTDFFHEISSDIALEPLRMISPELSVNYSGFNEVTLNNEFHWSQRYLSNCRIIYIMDKYCRSY